MLFDTDSGGSIGYAIQKSLRFRASASAYLSRTPSVAGNRKTWTWSGWVKRGKLGVQQGLFGAAESPSSEALAFNSSDQLVAAIYDNPNVTNIRVSSAVFRDPSAWYHIMYVWDSSNATAQLRARIYVNGVELTAWVTNNTLTQYYVGAINGTTQHTLGSNWTVQYTDGYISEINFIDGQALDPSYFGQVSAETGAWIPKKYTGTYGTNGFYLPFNDGSNLTNLTADRSGNGNNWTANNISLTAGSTYDWMDDTPSNNFAVLNAVHAGRSTLTNGNLTASGTTDLPTIIPDSGTWYFERGGVSQTWTPPAAFPSGSGDYNFGQRPFTYTPPDGFKALCTKNLPTGTITTSGTFSGNASTDGPFVYLNGVPTAMTINGNEVTLGNHADKLANGFKVRSSSASYNSAGSNTYSITSTGTKFKYSNAQGNP